MHPDPLRPDALLDMTTDTGVDDLVARFGPARHPERPSGRRRPDGVSDETVAALGKVSEALEVIENARGLLYEFHRLSGTADLTLQEAIDALHAAGHDELADEIDQVLVGRDVLPGYWTYQIVDAYDATYWQVFRACEEKARRVLGVADKHVYEADMKTAEQTAGAAADV